MNSPTIALMQPRPSKVFRQEHFASRESGDSSPGTPRLASINFVSATLGEGLNVAKVFLKEHISIL